MDPSDKTMIVLGKNIELALKEKARAITRFNELHKILDPDHSLATCKEDTELSQLCPSKTPGSGERGFRTGDFSKLLADYLWLYFDYCRELTKLAQWVKKCEEEDEGENGEEEVDEHICDIATPIETRRFENKFRQCESQILPTLLRKDVVPEGVWSNLRGAQLRKVATSILPDISDKEEEDHIKGIKRFGIK